jgi:hypothetical protein
MGLADGYQRNLAWVAARGSAGCGNFASQPEQRSGDGHDGLLPVTRAVRLSGGTLRRPQRSFPLQAGASTAPGMRGTLARQRLAFDDLCSVGEQARSAARPDRETDSGETSRAPALLSISSDPVFFSHRYADPQDQEIAAVVAALFAYGRVEVMARAIGAILDRLGERPRRALCDSVHRRRGWGRDLRYRFQRPADVVALLSALRDSIDRWGGLGLALADHADNADRRVDTT